MRWIPAMGVAMTVIAALAQEEPSAGPRTISASARIDASGALIPGLVRLTIAEGRIVAVDAPAGEGLSAEGRPDEYPGAVLCPGLIDCHAALGVLGELSERQTAVQPQVNARDTFNRFSHQLRAALAAGVTSFALAPDDQNLIGGRMAICQTSGPGGQAALLSDAGPLKLSLAPESFKTDREPTSRSGALGLLRDTLEAARRGTRPDAALVAFATGKLTGVLTARSAADVLSALEVTRDYGLRLVLIHTSDARQVAELAAGRVAGVIVGPFDLNATERDAAAAHLFVNRGVPVAIAGGLPQMPADSLRIGAAVAARAGLKPETARRAITAVPAELLGVGDQIGVLAKGYRADVVVFSGDPLDLRTRVLAVYVGGRRVYAAAVATLTGATP